MEDYKSKLTRLWVLVNKVEKSKVVPSDVLIEKNHDMSFSITFSNRELRFFISKKENSIPSKEFYTGLKIDLEFYVKNQSSFLYDIKQEFFFEGKYCYGRFSDASRLLPYKHIDTVKNLAKKYNSESFFRKNKTLTYSEVQYNEVNIEFEYQIKLGRISAILNEQEFLELKEKVLKNEEADDANFLKNVLSTFETPNTTNDNEEELQNHD